jgi:hypothetical protein
MTKITREKRLISVRLRFVSNRTVIMIKHEDIDPFLVIYVLCSCFERLPNSKNQSKRSWVFSSLDYSPLDLHSIEYEHR